MRKFFIIGIVIVSSVALTTLGIKASDYLTSNGTVGLAGLSDGPCGAGAVMVTFAGDSLCVDVFEASPSDMCPHADPASAVDTASNLIESACTAVSAPTTPWRYVSFAEAQQLCARTGKRLPKNEEWHQLALAVTDQSTCNVDSGAVVSGEGCVSGMGVSHLVGNVWEWVDETVVDNSYDNRSLPEPGFVALADSSGLAIETSETPNVTFGNDYAWTGGSGVTGLIRGGYYGAGDDAGVYAQNMTVSFDLRAPGIGFRCVRDIQ